MPSTQLATFTDQWNDDKLRLPDNHYNTPAKQEYRLRPSRLGRAAYVTAVEHLINLYGLDNIGVENAEYYGRRQDIFRTGHDKEALIVEMLRATGVEGLEYQVPCSFLMHGFTVEGTCDLIVDNVVVDIKTASASNYKRLLTGFNTLTYRTQLALYAHALGLDEVALLLYNKDTSELSYQPIRLTNELARVSLILEGLRKLEEALSLEDAWEVLNSLFEIGNPTPQMKNKVPTGTLLVPSELYFENNVLNVLWNVDINSQGVRHITSANDDPCETIRNTYK